jgi:FkbM family methyltransferase
MRLSTLASALSPLRYFERRFRRLERKLDQRAAFDEALAAGLIELFGALNRRLDVEPPRQALAPDVAAQLAALNHLLATVYAHQERMWGHLEFVRTRLNTYVGDGIVMAHALDGMPIYVNAYDVGCPSPLLNGGRYEEDNHQVLLSFLRPDTVFLDIGANIGFYTLQIGRRLSAAGRVYAFEPHPELSKILHRNVANLLLDRKVACFSMALSDHDGTLRLHYPRGHLGGGGVYEMSEGSGWSIEVVESEARRLNGVLGPDFVCDLVKIDVEGHEAEVLRGMAGIIASSPAVKILFEKLWPAAGSEATLHAFFAEQGFELYAVHFDASLSRLAGEQALHDWSGYVLAARPGTIEDGLRRRRFSIYPAQLWLVGGRHPPTARLEQSAACGGMLFHGPFWFLRRGVWRLKLHGKLSGALDFVLQEASGRPVLNFGIEEGRTEQVFVVDRDLLDFEFYVSAVSERAEIGLDRLELIQEG